MVDVLSTMYGATSSGCASITTAVAKSQLDNGSSIPETLTSTGAAISISGLVGSLCQSCQNNHLERAKDKYAVENAIVTEAYVDQMSDEELIQTLIKIGELEPENATQNEVIKSI